MQAVDGVTLEVRGRRDARPGRRVGLRQVDARPLPRAAARADRGHDRVRRAATSPGSRRRALRPLRREMQMVFQDPYASLNPRKRVGHDHRRPAADPRASRDRERQGARAGAARASSASRPSTTTATRTSSPAASGSASASPARSRCSPRLIVADEPVSALDVSIQAQVVNLLDDLQDEFALTYVFIAHDLGVVRHVSDRIAVMYLGKIVEVSPAEELYAAADPPLHRGAAVGRADPRPGCSAQRERIVLEGDVPSPIAPPSRLPLPSALPLRDRDLLRRGAAAGRPRRRAISPPATTR